MELSGLHLLLTYRCNVECDHCFVWGSPWQNGTMTLRQVTEILQQGVELGSVRWIYFEGGEPFLYYVLLERGVRLAVEHGFRIGIVSNAYWATSLDDAREWLRPFAGAVEDLSLSCDAFHCTDAQERLVDHACAAAGELGIPVDVISIAAPETSDATAPRGQLPPGESGVMYRGRAAKGLASRARLHDWTRFGECPHEDLRDPGRVHIDPFGNVHVCQGISIGNVFRTSLAEICRRYEPETHPIVGPLLEGGPADLVRRYHARHDEEVADACHLCYQVRDNLRGLFPEDLAPPQMYGCGLS